MIAVPAPVLAASALLWLAAAPFPAIDVARLCSGAAVSVDGDRTEASCRRQEVEARSRLRALWRSLPAPDRSVCLGDAELGVARSYADIVGCLETERELRREERLKRTGGAAARR